MSVLIVGVVAGALLCFVLGYFVCTLPGRVCGCFIDCLLCPFLILRSAICGEEIPEGALMD